MTCLRHFNKNASRLAPVSSPLQLTREYILTGRGDRTEKMFYPVDMRDVLEIEKAIEKLPREDYAKLRDWIEKYDLETDAVMASACIADMLDEEDGGGDQLTGE